MTNPSEEEFAVWRENPITEWVLAGVQRFADAQQPSFARLAWGADPAEWDDLRLTRERIRARQDAYEGLAKLTYEQALGLHEETASDG